MPDKPKKIQLALTIERAQGDDAALTIPVSFASDAIIDDPWLGPVRLSMDPGAISLENAEKNGIPVRLMHRRDLPVARVYDVRLEDSKLRGNMKFSANQSGRDLYRDAADGIITDTSVGAEIYAVQEREDHLLAVSWEPKEVSLVDIGADQTVGVNRQDQGAEVTVSLEDVKRELAAFRETIFPRWHHVLACHTSMLPEPATVQRQAQNQNSSPPSGDGEDSLPAAPAASPQQQPTEVTRMSKGDQTSTDTAAGGAAAIGTPQAQPNHAQNAQQITDLGKYAHQRAPHLGIDRLADDYAAFDKPFEEFKGVVWRMLSEHQDSKPQAATPPSEIGMSQKEAGQFSICRAVMAHLTKDWSKAGFELEASQAVIQRLGNRPGNGGFFVPLEVQRQWAPTQLQRAASVGDAAKGGYLVAEEHRADLFIEGLRSRSVAFAAGVQLITGLVGNVEIPRETSGTTFYWLSEGEPVTLTDPGFGLITMTPRTLAGGVPLTRRLLMQSSPDVETFVRQKLTQDASLKMDLSVFEGDGVKQPLGIINQTGINTSTIASAGAPTWAETVKFESDVDTANALMDSLAYVLTPAVAGNMKTTSVDTGSGVFVMAQDGTVNGYASHKSSQLTANSILFGNFSDTIVGMWGVLEIKPDEAGLASSGGLILRLFQDCDIVVRHAASYCKNA